MANLELARKTLVINGKSYKVRYYTERNGKTIAVCNTDELRGDYGDEWPVTVTETGGATKVTPCE